MIDPNKQASVVVPPKVCLLLKLKTYDLYHKFILYYIIFCNCLFVQNVSLYIFWFWSILMYNNTTFKLSIPTCLFSCKPFLEKNIKHIRIRENSRVTEYLVNNSAIFKVYEYNIDKFGKKLVWKSIPNILYRWEARQHIQAIFQGMGLEWSLVRRLNIFVKSTLPGR